MSHHTSPVDRATVFRTIASDAEILGLPVPRMIDALDNGYITCYMLTLDDVLAWARHFGQRARIYHGGGALAQADVDINLGSFTTSIVGSTPCDIAVAGYSYGHDHEPCITQVRDDYTAKAVQW